ncbi:molybdenum cofactor guanylyltransferase [Agromyces sp. Marseille-Q5079]|uniref:molybdenum cofactor guanylyltransferase n=1 Tax=Agromyces sp. Marseille-Q5079 TaxID=3439059 RepID=UPI003D9CBAFA
MTDAATRPLDAVLLAGGRASRLDGASKPDLEVGGRTLLQHAVDAARSAGVRRIVVVGPSSLVAPGCLVVRENPPFGGPVAAIAAGLAALDAASRPSGGAVDRSSNEPSQDLGIAAAASDVLVLACDLPAAGLAVARLLAHRADDESGAPRDGACLVDADGRTQWLTAVYARAVLDRAFAALDRPADGAAMRHLVASLDLVAIDDAGSAADVDTWADLERARAAHESAADHARADAERGIADHPIRPQEPR